MAAKSFASRLRGSRRFLSGFVAGAVAGAASTGLVVVQFLRSRDAEPAAVVRDPDGSSEKAVLEQFGFPLAGTETRCYTNHALSYDQSKRVPRWVLEHISKSKIMGAADRKHCKFKPDPNIPPAFSAFNEDYIGSGWSRGHMAPAGNNKFSTKAMAETFYLSNIVPQNFDNNAGYWNRIEMYCRELTERFEDVWIVSGPLTLPQTGSDGKKTVSYQINTLEGLWDVACLRVSWCWRASSGRLLSSRLTILPWPRQPSPLAGPSMCVGEGYRQRDDDSQPLALCVPSLCTLHSGSQLCLGLSVPHFPGGGIKKCRHLWEPLLESHCLRGSPGPRPAGF
ncbi:PREDICTED: nuclease EXOG, mitochondrial isoform X2 [Capra hircus]|uniref:nuclease EXOG, mitochondrial isoform X2 n=1 Tax=Capra hircus TaxID=9925 RepID=UPI000847D1E5|nr:PREDICTED: nuclease EXOG, mitochondrial isoform X2 [Capra hircus]